MAFSESDSGKVPKLSARLAFDPDYRITPDSGAGTEIYALLFCNGSRFKLNNLHVGIYLWGSARITDPSQLTWDQDLHQPQLNIPDPHGSGFTLRDTSLTIDQQRWNNVQQLAYTIHDLMPCIAGPRTLASTPSLVDGFGIDAYSSFIVLGQLAEHRNVGRVLGIPGPVSVYTTPIIGGVPTRDAPPVSLIPVGARWFVETSVPSEISVRVQPSHSTFIRSNPQGINQSGRDILSAEADSAQIFTSNDDAVSIFSRVNEAMLVAASIAAGIVSTRLYDLFRSDTVVSEAKQQDDKGSRTPRRRRKRTKKARHLRRRP